MKMVKSIAYFLSISFLFFSCFKKEEFKNIEIQEVNPGWGVPLLDSRLELKDLIAIIDTTIGIKEEADKSYTFYYYDTLSSPKAEDIFQLRDQSFSKVIPSTFLPSITFPVGTELSNSFSQTENFDAGNGSNLKHIDLKDGQIALTISSIFKNRVSIELTLYSLLDPSKKPLVRSYEMTPDKPFISDVINLQGYQIKLSDNSSETNAFKYSVNYKVTSTGQPLSGSDGLSVSINLKSLKYRLIVGDIGDIKFPSYFGDLGIKVFDQSIYGNVYFEQARLDLAFDNSFGIPVDFTINKLRSSTSYGKTVDITPTSPPFLISLVAPTLAEAGSFKRKEVMLDRTNSRIVDAVNPAPNSLEYDFATSIVHGANNFVLDESRINVYGRIAIPIKGYVVDYVLSDTIPIKKLPERTFTENEISGALDSVVFKMKVENAIPANVYTQLYFLDKNYQKIDSLLVRPDAILASDNVDPVSGEVISPTIRELVITYNASRYERLRAQGAYFNVTSRATTTVDKTTGKQINIKLQSNNSLHVIISVLTKGKIKIQ